MKSYLKYYVVDSVTESIIGSFDAINFDMALMMIQKGILENPKLKDFSSQFLVYVSDDAISVCETYDEVTFSLTEVSDFWEKLDARRKNDNGRSVAADN